MSQKDTSNPSFKPPRKIRKIRLNQYGTNSTLIPSEDLTQESTLASPLHRSHMTRARRTPLKRTNSVHELQVLAGDSSTAAKALMKISRGKRLLRAELSPRPLQDWTSDSDSEDCQETSMDSLPLSQEWSQETLPVLSQETESQVVQSQSQEEYQTQWSQNSIEVWSPSLPPLSPLNEQISCLSTPLNPNSPHLPTVPSEKSKFRFRGISLFCTFPQCAVAKEVALKNILNRWEENVEYAVVAEEKHKDNKPHLHVLIRFRNQISSYNARFADFICGSHGNYKPAKPMWRAYQYTVKDGCYVVHGVVPQGILSQASKKCLSQTNGSGKVSMDEVAGSLMSGASVKDIFYKYPGKFLMYRSRIESFKEFQNVAERQQIEDFPGFDVPEDLRERDPFLFELVQWLQLNLVEPKEQKKPRPFKSPQLYLYGAPSTGKTSMILQLMKFFRVYFLPMDEEFYDEYEDDLYDLVVLEEFSSQKPITWLNSFLDGAPKTIRKKQRQYLKTKNIPVIILSNLSPDECYSNVAEKHPSSFEAFKIRLQILEVPLCSVPINVDGYDSDSSRFARHVRNAPKYFIKLPIRSSSEEDTEELPNPCDEEF